MFFKLTVNRIFIKKPILGNMFDCIETINQLKYIFKMVSLGILSFVLLISYL